GRDRASHREVPQAALSRWHRPCTTTTGEVWTMFQRILCATDFSDTAEAAWAAARELARTQRAELILVHVFTELPIYPDVAVLEVQRVWEDQRAWVERELAERVTAATARGLTARWVFKTGVAPESIVETAAEEHADLI